MQKAPPRDSRPCDSTPSTSSAQADEREGQEEPFSPVPALEPSSSRPLGQTLRVLNWLVPGLLCIAITHLATSSSHAAGAGSSSSWMQRPGAFGTLHGSGPVVVSACGASGGTDAMQLVFANYANCTAGRGSACSAASEWSTSSGWSDGYSS